MKYLHANLSLLVLAFFLVTASQAEDGIQKDNGQISLNFRDVDIKQFIESVSKISKHNFLIDRRVSGKVTIIASEPIPRENLYDLMLSVLHFYGFAAVPDGDITKIVVAADAARFAPSEVENEQHELITEVVRVRNIDADQLTKVIRPMLSKNAQVVSLPKGDSLIISDVQTNLVRIKKIIGSVDVVEVRDYEIIQLQHAPVGDMISLVNSIYKNNNKAISLNLQADKRTNRLIVTASTDVREAIRELISNLDTPLVQDGNVKVIYLRYADAQNLANILNRLTSSEAFKSVVAEQKKEQQTEGSKEAPKEQPKEQPEEQPVQQTAQTSVTDIKSGIQADTALNALIVSGSPSFILAVEGIIRQLDVRRAQIIIETIIAELTDDFQRELGVDWGTIGSSGTAILDLSGNLAAVGSAATGVGAAAAAATLGRGGLIGGIASGSLDGGWGALYRVLSSDSRSNVLSTPYIVTLDNEEATFNVGRNIPVRTSEVESDGDITTNYERRDVGISLVIKPQVTGSDTIKLTINQEVSDVLDSRIDGQIQTTQRKITTTVQMRDGGLVALGGLLEDNQQETSSKVPGLGDVPFLGYLFRSQKSSLRKTNLMIFMRPRIIKDDATIASFSYGKYNNIRQAQLNHPRSNSLFFAREVPRLRDLSELSFFTDLGRGRDYRDLLVPQEDE